MHFRRSRYDVNDRELASPLGTEGNPWTDKVIELRGTHEAVADVRYGQFYRPNASSPPRALSPENAEDVELMERIKAQNEKAVSVPTEQD